MKRPAQTIGGQLARAQQRITLRDVTVLRVGNGIADVRTGDGAIYRNVQIGGVAVGQVMQMQFVDGKPIGATGGGAYNGSVIQSAVSNALTLHALDGAYHDGTLDDDQAPQFLKSDGSRQLTGNMAVSAGVTIDDVDISEFHAALTTCGLRTTVARGRITLQPTLTQGNYLYSNTYITLSPAQPDTNYSVFLGTINGPAVTFVGDQTVDGFTIWAMIDQAIQGGAITPTLDYEVVRWVN
jgi:hypothetical protein